MITCTKNFFKLLYVLVTCASYLRFGTYKKTLWKSSWRKIRRSYSMLIKIYKYRPYVKMMCREIENVD